MGKPKKQTSSRKTGLRRSHLLVKLARMVNKTSPVKAYTTKRESGKKLAAKTSTTKKTTTAAKKKAASK